jgi:hypothetical protein
MNVLAIIAVTAIVLIVVAMWRLKMPSPPIC